MLLNVPTYLLFCSCLAVTSHAIRPEEESWSVAFDDYNELRSFTNSLFKNTKINIKIHCNDLYNISVNWILTAHSCWGEIARLGQHNIRELQLQEIVNDAETNHTNFHFVWSVKHQFSCASDIHLEDLSIYETNKTYIKPMDEIYSSYTVYTVPRDGIYLLTLNIKKISDKRIDKDEDKFFANVEVTMKSPYGYLSAADLPLLHFYGFMCLVYLCFGVTWLILLFMQWRDLLQIQFWIGTVILLGMVEKATFYAEYHELNLTGHLDNIYGVMTLAEVVSCLKRSLARILVFIVSLGFGIIKPRLGPLLSKVLGIGFVYFTMSLMESYFRSSANMSTGILLIQLSLVAVDFLTVYWIFKALTQTTRALRLRRNAVKLQLYTHFTNVLGFTVVTSALFMVYSMKTQYFTICSNWKEQWLHDAFWHIEFSIILLVIMILWRPTNNNQRYAFTPLLDAPDDDGDETELFMKETFNDVRMRTAIANTSNQDSVIPYKDYPASNSSTKSQTYLDDDLKWVEENIPGSLCETTVPILDDSENDHCIEIERSKLQ